MKNPFKKINAKTKELAMKALIMQLQASKTACENKSTKITDRAKLGFVLMSLEDGLKKEKTKPTINQNVIKVLEAMIEWAIETLKAWKNQEWEKINFEIWNEVIDWFENQTVSIIVEGKAG